MEKVSYDMRTNFETQLSTIGGTLGLFAGFSILSAVEIMFHLGKTIIENMKRKQKKMHKIMNL